MPWLEAAGVALDSQGRIKAGVESVTGYQTSQEKIFARRRCRARRRPCSDGMAEGRHAAQGILDYLARKKTPLH
ncbi:pyridine nucleotide-disulfide oxidoreductase family protein [Klebsiella pneumoniae]|uniref:Pyridine nucleotide-disulfide oxidoreductase family protein n=1 Tax=Klebsiella pneumoniae TaxID=573 RepID=A0A378FXD5_KLEPN|nr:pyridine nucleotide-disulfide oxidoreductase family protein [Klebsiella pneumoniae]